MSDLAHARAAAFFVERDWYLEEWAVRWIDACKQERNPYGDLAKSKMREWEPDPLCRVG